MPQLFPQYANLLARLSLLGAGIAVAGGLIGLRACIQPRYILEENVAPEQPVPFSHQHHVAGLGLDCRYCHNSVETSSFAGMPPTETCMTCHSQIWGDSPMLETVRESYFQDKPVEWTRVYDLPDFVHFDHSIHVNSGVACQTCHGRVDKMPLTQQTVSLTMKWCLDCHRDPGPNLRPREAVFDMGWRSLKKENLLGERLVKEYEIDVSQLDNCSVCHY